MAIKIRFEIMKHGINVGRASYCLLKYYVSKLGVVGSNAVLTALTQGEGSKLVENILT